MADWLDGVDRSVVGRDSGPFVDAPMRLVLHTTEGASAAGAIAAFKSTGSWPHFTVDGARQIRYQHIPVNLAARALVHAAGTAETNRAGAIQIEMVGFAHATQDLTDDVLQWFATEVVAPILAACPITTDHPAFVGADQSPSGVNAKQRMTEAAWTAFNGICGHQHVPCGNDHWDPGAFPIDRCLAFLNPSPAPVPSPTPPEENDTMRLRQPQGGSDNGKVFLVGACSYRYIKDPARLPDLEAEYGPVTPINPVAWGDTKASLVDKS